MLLQHPTACWKAEVSFADSRCLHRQVRRMGYGDGFRWVAQYIK